MFFLPTLVLVWGSALLTTAFGGGLVLVALSVVPGVFLGLLSVIWSEGWVFPDPTVRGSFGRTEDVELLQPELADWYHGNVPVEGVQDIAVGMARMCDIARAAAHPVAQWVYDEEVAPALSRLWLDEQRLLVERAHRAGFPLPLSFTASTLEQLAIECREWRPGDPGPVVDL